MLRVTIRFILDKDIEILQDNEVVMIGSLKWGNSFK